MSPCAQNAIQFAFEALHPCAQSLRAAGSKAYEQVNVVWHEDISPDANPKVRGAAAVFHEGCMYLGTREQAGPNMGIKRNEIDRRIEALEDQIQSWRLALERVRCPQRTSSEIITSKNPLRAADTTAPAFQNCLA